MKFRPLLAAGCATLVAVTAFGTVTPALAAPMDAASDVAAPDAASTSSLRAPEILSQKFDAATYTITVTGRAEPASVVAVAVYDQTIASVETRDSADGGLVLFTVTIDATWGSVTAKFTSAKGGESSSTMVRLDNTPSPTPVKPVVERITPTASGGFTVAGVSERSQMVVARKGGTAIATGGAHQGRFSLQIPAGHAGQEVDLYGSASGLVSDPLRVVLKEMSPPPVEAPPAPVVGAVTKTDEGFRIESVVPYRTDEVEEPVVLATDPETGQSFLTGRFSHKSQFTNTVPASFAGKDITLTAFRGADASQPVTVRVAERANDVAVSFPLEVSSPAAGSTVDTPAPTFRGDAIPNSQIVVKSGATGSSAGDTLCSVVAATSGDWSCTSGRLPSGPVSAVVTETPYFSSGAIRKATRNFEIRAGASEHRPVAVTSHASGDAYVEGLTTFTGVGTPGARIRAVNQWGTLMGTASVDADGTWSFVRNLGPTTPSYILTFTQTSGSETDSTRIELRFAREAVAITSPADGSLYSDGVASFRGTGKPGAAIRAVNQWGTMMGTATVDANGSWSFARNLGPTTAGYDITVTQTPKEGTVTSARIHIDHRPADGAPVRVISHKDGQSYSTGVATFRGTALAGARVVAVNQWGTLMGSATAARDGSWSFDRNLGPTTDGYEITFTATRGSDVSTQVLSLKYAGASQR